MADQAAVIQALIDAATAATAAANAAAAAAAAVTAAVQAPAQQLPPILPNPVPFALNPGAAMNNVLDFTKSQDMKYYSKATTGLSTKFDLNSEGLNSFLERLSDQANLYDWSNVLIIPDGNVIPRNLIREYGLLTMENCRDHAATYVRDHTLQAQNSLMLHTCIINSLTEEASKIMLSDTHDFTVLALRSGPCLLKALIRRSSVDTAGTAMTLRRAIGNLSGKMIELQSDIRAFNLYVTGLKNALLARGHVVEDELLLNLFDAYSVVSDQDFVRYIQHKQDNFDDGALVTVDQLMTSALTKYDTRVEKKAWNSLDNQGERIVALEAELAKAKQNQKTPKLRKDPKGAEYAWKKVSPKDGTTTKTVKGKKYHWCTKRKAWTIHTPAQCTLELHNAENVNDIKLSPALQAIVDEDNSQHSEE
jgi:hypothetical protein